MSGPERGARSGTRAEERCHRRAGGTNTILDDGIDLYPDGVLLTGREKTRCLGWRGYPGAGGVWVDDSGAPTNVGRGHGDMRPDPMLLPIFRAALALATMLASTPHRIPHVPCGIRRVFDHQAVKSSVSPSDRKPRQAPVAE